MIHQVNIVWWRSGIGAAGAADLRWRWRCWGFCGSRVAVAQLMRCGGGSAAYSLRSIFCTIRAISPDPAHLRHLFYLIAPQSLKFSSPSTQ